MTLPNPFYSRKGIIYMRWRGAVALACKSAPEPEEDRLASQVLADADVSAEPPLRKAFADGYQAAARRQIELAYERMPYATKAQARALRAAGSLESPSSVRTFHWYGQFAFAKGIDRSPSHDPQAAKRLKTYPNEAVLSLIRAWEAGWDDAYDSSMELALERRSILETPRVFGARHIRPASSNSKKD